MKLLILLLSLSCTAGDPTSSTASNSDLRVAQRGGMGHGRPIAFEPHLRRLEDDMIRSMYFKVSLHQNSTKHKIKITVRAFLRDRCVMKQRVDCVTDDGGNDE